MQIHRKEGLRKAGHSEHGSPLQELRFPCPGLEGLELSTPRQGNMAEFRGCKQLLVAQSRLLCALRKEGWCSPGV